MELALDLDRAVHPLHKALDRAHLKVSSGAFDYNSAVRSAVDSLADTMKYVTYPTGHKDTLEVACRRAVLTGVNQTAAKLQIARADEMEVAFFEVTAHGGARPSHAEWQGQIYHRGGPIDYLGRHYKDFESTTGYGTGGGLCGWNCRHTFFAAFPELGAPPVWTRESLARLNAREIEYNGQKYTRYEISQMQRAKERTVRKYKRRYLAETESGVDATQSAVRLKAARQDLAAFTRATGTRNDSARTRVYGFGRSEAGKATSQAQQHHTQWLKSINAQSTSLNTVAKYYDAKYNNTEEYQLLMQYSHSVKTGWLSPLTGFDLYKNTHDRIQNELVGKTAADGTVITGHTIHFMERVFGTTVDPKKLKENHEIIRRSGTDFWKIADAITSPVMPSRKVTDKLGRTSIIFFGKYAQVSMNEKGELIQCQPKERKN